MFCCKDPSANIVTTSTRATVFPRVRLRKRFANHDRNLNADSCAED